MEISELMNKIKLFKRSGIQEKELYFKTGIYQFPKIKFNVGRENELIVVHLPKKTVLDKNEKKKRLSLSAIDTERLFGFDMGQEIEINRFREIINE